MSTGVDVTVSATDGAGLPAEVSHHCSQQEPHHEGESPIVSYSSCDKFVTLKLASPKVYII